MLNRIQQMGEGEEGEGEEVVGSAGSGNIVEHGQGSPPPPHQPPHPRRYHPHHHPPQPPTSRSPSNSSIDDEFPMHDEPGPSQISLKRRVETLVTGIKDLYGGCFSQDSPYKKYIRNRESTFAVEPLLNSLKDIGNGSRDPILAAGASSKQQLTKPPRLKEWLQIACFELEQKVGTTSYKFSESNVIVDGYTSTSHRDRLCLGAIENHNRDSIVIPVRRQIGAGIELIRGETSITLTVLSDSPIFVQAPLYALSKNEVSSTVFRLAKGESIEIYNEGIFTIELASRIHEKSRVYEMQSMVTCRVSFVKGFGLSYRRPSIMQVPCWIEIHFQDPLQAIDSELRKMEEMGELVLRSFS